MNIYPKSRTLTVRALYCFAAITISSLLVACDRSTKETPVVSSPDVPKTDTIDVSSIPTGTPSSWDASLGPLIVVPGRSGLLDDVSLISPGLFLETPVHDTTGIVDRLGDGRVDLFSRSGLVGQAILKSSVAVSTDSSFCAEWPTGKIASVQIDTDSVASTVPSSNWLFGLRSGRARAIVLDSIENLKSRDSASLAAAVTRLASTIPVIVEDTSSPFRGLPFTVNKAYMPLDSSGLVMAVLVRRVPQEDRPLEERVLILVERNSDSKLNRLLWFERVSGREEDVIASEPLAFLSQNNSSGADLVVLSRDDGSGSALATLQRKDQEWFISWESPVSGC